MGEFEQQEPGPRSYVSLCPDRGQHVPDLLRRGQWAVLVLVEHPFTTPDG